MKTDLQKEYLTPELEVLNVCVEQGFAGSPEGGESGGGESVGGGTDSEW